MVLLMLCLLTPTLLLLLLVTSRTSGIGLNTNGVVNVTTVVHRAATTTGWRCHSRFVCRQVATSTIPTTTAGGAISGTTMID
uniref:Putative secreted protein n=1 Tax=Anopheles darlingi TaxID=43151 RepID=A0A2M4D9Y9_ANODA